jgi:trehalose synthase
MRSVSHVAEFGTVQRPAERIEPPAGDDEVPLRVLINHDVGVSMIHPVEVPARPVERLRSVVGDGRYARLVVAAKGFRKRLAHRTIWNVNSTATGGGVAEMLQALVGYVEDLDIPIRWSVISGDAEFFAVTKRLHNLIHGRSDGVALTGTDAAHYAAVLAANGDELLAQVRPGDIVLLHDPQTAGLVGALVAAGARVVWRCHIGLDQETAVTRQGWEFLRPHLVAAHGFVFTRRAYVPSWVPGEQTWIIPPSIDPFSAKNQELAPDTVRAILSTIGLLDGGRPGQPGQPGRFTRRDGRVGEVARTAVVAADALPGAADPVVVQVSRWDRLKDMVGVMRGFAGHVAAGGPGYLMLVGPDVRGVSDDPEGALVYKECLTERAELPAAVRERVMLVTLPLDDVDENAAMVNAVQRYATVIAQKSLAEGFGLTVAEGMWKGRAVVGSAVGGIVDQIPDGTGVLLADPADLAAFGSVISRLLADPDGTERMGRAAHAHVRDEYVGDLHLLRYAELFGTLI